MKFFATFIALFPTSISAAAEFGRNTLEEKKHDERNLRRRSLELLDSGDFSMPEIETSMSLPSTIPDLVPAAISLSRYGIPTNAPISSSGRRESWPTYVPTSATPTYTPTAVEAITESGSPTTYGPSIADDTGSGGSPTYAPTSAYVEASSLASATPTYAPTIEDDMTSSAATGSSATPTYTPTVLMAVNTTESDSLPPYAPSASESNTTTWPTYVPTSNASETNSSTIQVLEDTTKPSKSPSLSIPTSPPEEEKGGFLNTLWGGVQNAWGFVTGKKEKSPTSSPTASPSASPTATPSASPTSADEKKKGGILGTVWVGVQNFFGGN